MEEKEVCKKVVQIDKNATLVYRKYRVLILITLKERAVIDKNATHVYLKERLVILFTLKERTVI